ncbi:FMN-dependent NADH-azoreductase [Pseudoalteromonas tunicata]|jgi:FMN-dependent NADH-azoreductase|uniref:FMN dependent NADH:quinone oxidoreductase n=1 Tax=Pseudoalteromonas tunicata D2 TaxID=87626 RepID=A4C449_9GAMM|nr:NAD(P)H-dependent oxidoreductase [Pseudoalteromonas tunicata]ATC97188.1 FMN-dependent NADH-azoreductase [Pseudoalteromonas tunicata]AXT33472.1 FMN-dependent NADH-azoreductase [Pseudoalteromonas tunicata]EAR30331.1 (Acyl-carrier protein) phosphodiesterase [Pseudoalteromonas tunicata D2]MDP4984730.1 NAD(P)H-dependent oxidoreductase [Pseudoalteromonas tunicata]
MNSILFIQTSLSGAQSQSNLLAQELISKIGQSSDIAVTVRDLTTTELPHLTASEMQSWQIPVQERTSEQIQLAELSDNLISELEQHQTLVIALPMYNFGVPSHFKAWIDRIARAGITFEYTEQGPKGLINNKKVIVVASRGGVYAGTEKDSQTQYLKDVLAFLGMDDVTFIYAEGLNMPIREQGLAQARSSINNLLSADLV